MTETKIPDTAIRVLAEGERVYYTSCLGALWVEGPAFIASSEEAAQEYAASISTVVGWDGNTYPVRGVELRNDRGELVAEFVRRVPA